MGAWEGAGVHRSPWGATGGAAGTLERERTDTHASSRLEVVCDAARLDRPTRVRRVDVRVGPTYSRVQMLAAGLPVDDLIWFTAGPPQPLYPVSQFDVVAGRLERRPDVLALWTALGSAGLGRLARWMWITRPKATLDGLTPLECLGRWRLEPELDDVIDRLVAGVLAA